MAARLPVGRLLDFLRTDDSPHPWTTCCGPRWLVRARPMPSFDCRPWPSRSALVIFAAWMRDRGRAGLIATAVLACSSCQILHGGEARMCAPRGSSASPKAMLADAGFARPAGRSRCSPRSSPSLCSITSRGSCSRPACSRLPGLRGDRRRVGVASGVVVACMAWAVVWGPSSASRQAVTGSTSSRTSLG